MDKKHIPYDASIWEAAWAWVGRQYDADPDDQATNEQLVQWLELNPAHRLAYERASRIWLAAGLVPPVNDLTVPGCTSPAGQQSRLAGDKH